MFYSHGQPRVALPHLAEMDCNAMFCSVLACSYWGFSYMVPQTTTPVTCPGDALVENTLYTNKFVAGELLMPQNQM